MVPNLVSILGERYLENISIATKVFDSDAPELSSARLSSDSARAGDFSARLSSARGVFGIACLAKILLKQAICRV